MGLWRRCKLQCLLNATACSELLVPANASWRPASSRSLRVPPPRGHRIVDLRAVEDTRSVATALRDLKDGLEALTESVDAVEEELSTHEERYFASWRSPDVEGKLAAVRAATAVLDKRLDTLQKVAVITRQLLLA